MTPPSQMLGASRPEMVTDEVPGGARPGWIALATSGDHKAVGRMFIATSLTFLAAALAELVLMRIQLIIPEFDLMRPVIFDRLLSIYGVTAVLLFAVPLLLGLISYVVPLQIGARRVALPRLHALSFWTFLAGAISLYTTLLYQPSEAGTTAPSPLADRLFSPRDGVDGWILGVGLVTLGFVLFAVSMLVTLNRLRAPGMVWRRVPMFSWAARVISATLLVIGPLMIAAVSMLFIDRNFDGVFYDPDEGGAPVLYEHLSWIFFTGIYAVILVGAFGAISEILPTFSRQPQFAPRTIAASMAAFAVLVTTAWMQNMYSGDIPIGVLYATMLLALAAAIPFGLMLFNWIATISGSRVRMKPPMRFAIAAIALMTLGLAGELAQSVIPVSWQYGNTMVAWGDTHLALIGGGVLGGFAALQYWFPKITGRLMGETMAGASLTAIVVGTLAMVVPIQLAGAQGMPVDVYKFFGDTGMSAYNLIGTLGALLLAVGVILSLVNAAASYSRGAAVGPDPWGGATLEWFTLSPPPPHNFDLVPDVRSNEPLADIRAAVRGRITEWTPPPARSSERGDQPAAVGGTERSSTAGEGSAREATERPDRESSTGGDGGSLA